MPRYCLLVIALGFAANGCSLPWDPEGTLDRVRGQVLRVGISHHPPWTDIRSQDEPTGDEVQIVERLAEELGAEIEWHRSGEIDLMKRLEHFEIDLVIGGLTKDTPWKKRVGLTKPHTKAQDQEYVLAAPPGENAWILYLDRHIHKMQNAPE